MIRIVVDENIPGIADYFTAGVSLLSLPGRDIDAAAVKDADVLLVRSVTRVDSELLQNAKVRFVASATSGLDHINLDYLEQRGIAFSAAQGANAQAVVEYVISMMARFSTQGLYDERSRRVGIVGAGRVGGRLNKLLRSLGFETKIYDPFLADDSSLAGGILTSLEEVMSCDVLTVHAPLSTDGEHPTIKMIGAEQLALLPNDAWLIQAARGGIIDEAALIAFLAERRNLSSAVDVWCNEPNIDKALLSLVDMATPHIAGYSKEAKEKATLMIVKSLRDFLVRESDWPQEAILNEEKPPRPDAASSQHRYSPELGLHRFLEGVYSFNDLNIALRRAMTARDSALSFDALRKQILKRRSELSSISVELRVNPLTAPPRGSVEEIVRCESDFDIRLLTHQGAVLSEV